VAGAEKVDLLAPAAVAVVERTDSVVGRDALASGLLAELVVLEGENPELTAAWTAFSGVCNQLAVVGCSTAAAAALVGLLLQQPVAAVAEQLEELLAAAVGLDCALVGLVAEERLVR
jgi:hypothetical protein